MSENVVILKDARKAWLSVAQLENHENEIFIFSPYITGEIMGEIVKLKGDKRINLVTSLNSSALISEALI